MKEGERQCPAIYATRGGVVFCVKPEGHEGDHRGFRAQWNDEERVKITEREYTRAQWNDEERVKITEREYTSLIASLGKR